MRSGALTSGFLHVGVIALAVVGLPELFRPDPVDDQPVVVEIVSLRQEPEPEPPKPKPKPPPPQVKPPPPPPAVKPPPKPVVAAPPPKPKPKPKVKPKPKPKVKSVKVAPIPKRKPKPPPDDFQRLLKDLRKMAKRNPVQMQTKAVSKGEPRRAPVSDIDRRRQIAALANLVKRQVSPCWTVHAGAKDAQTMRVGVRILLNPDGSLRGPPRILDSARMQRDDYFRAAAESALRALRNPRCSPLNLPLDKYEIWKEISFNFDPKDLLGP